MAGVFSGRPIGRRQWLGPTPLSGARHDEPRLVGDDHRLRPVAQPELAQDVADVRLHRLVAEDELLGDLAIRETLRDEPEDLGLAG